MSRETSTKRSSVSASPASPASAMAARMPLPKVGQRDAHRLHMVGARRDLQRIGGEARVRRCDLSRAARGAAQHRDALRQVVDVALNGHVDGVEELVQRDEGGALHVPVGLLHLGCEVHRVGEARVEQLDHRGACVVGNVDLRGVQ